MNFWEFCDKHPFIDWCALWTMWGVHSLIRRLMSTIMVAIRGWPPEHLDAGGDWKTISKREES
jgi:hypothetical protein